MKNFLIKAVSFDKEMASLRNGGDAGGMKSSLKILSWRRTNS